MNTPNANQKKGISSPYLSTGNGSSVKELPKVVPSVSNAIEIPSIARPKNGRSLKDIDKKSEVNAANSTDGFSISVQTTPVRNIKK